MNTGVMHKDLKRGLVSYLGEVTSMALHPRLKTGPKFRRKKRDGSETRENVKMCCLCVDYHRLTASQPYTAIAAFSCSCFCIVKHELFR